MLSQISTNQPVVSIVNDINRIIDESNRIDEIARAVEAKTTTFVTNTLNSTLADLRTDINDFQIDAASIGDGSVSNAEFGYYQNVSSSLQGQLNDLSRQLNNWRSQGGTVQNPIRARAIADGSVSQADLEHIKSVSENIQETLNDLSNSVRRAEGGEISFGANNISTNDAGTETAVTNDEFKRLDGVTGNIQNQLSAIWAKLDSIGTIAGNSLTVNAASIADGSVSNTAFSYLSGLTTTDIQATLNTFFNTVSNVGTFSSHELTNIPANRIADGSVSNTAFAFLTGATGNLQSRINSLRTILGSVGDVSGNTVTVSPVHIGDGTGDERVSLEEWQRTQNLTSSFQTQLNDLNTRIATLGTVSGNTVMINASRIGSGSVNNNEFNRIAGTTSSMQAQINSVNSTLASLGTLDTTNNTVNVNATAIGNGTVDNTELGYISGATSNLQTQINNKLLSDGTIRRFGVKQNYTGAQTVSGETAHSTLSLPTGVQASNITGFASNGLHTYLTTNDSNVIYSVDIDETGTEATATEYTVGQANTMTNIIWNEMRQEWVFLYEVSGNIIAAAARPYIHGESEILTISGSITAAEAQSATICWDSLFYWSGSQLVRRRITAEAILAPENITLYASGSAVMADYSGRLGTLRGNGRNGLLWVREGSTANTRRINVATYDSENARFNVVSSGTGIPASNGIASTDTNTFKLEGDDLKTFTYSAYTDPADETHNLWVEYRAPGTSVNSRQYLDLDTRVEPFSDIETLDTLALSYTEQTVTKGEATSFSLTTTGGYGAVEGFIDGLPDGLTYYDANNMVTGTVETTASSGDLDVSYAFRDSIGREIAGTLTISVEGGVPGIPRNVRTSSITHNSVDVLWNAPATNASEVSEYEICWQTGTDQEACQTVGADTLTFTIDGLAAETSYNVRVRSNGDDGNSDFSTAVSFTTAAAPLNPPDVPTSVSASATGTTSISVSWTAPTTGGTPTGYHIEYRTGLGNWITRTDSASPYSITGLSPGTEYQIRVRATNADGNSGWIYATNTRTTNPPRPTQKPGVPRNLTASISSGGTLSIDWDTPSSGDSVTNYVYQYRFTGGSWSSTRYTGTSTSASTSLTYYGDYEVRVDARNSGGSSAWVYANTSWVRTNTPMDAGGPYELQLRSRESTNTYRVSIRVEVDGDSVSERTLPGVESIDFTSVVYDTTQSDNVGHNLEIDPSSNEDTLVIVGFHDSSRNYQRYMSVTFTGRLIESQGSNSPSSYPFTGSAIFLLRLLVL